jgi:hypothetical protein
MATSKIASKCRNISIFAKKKNPPNELSYLFQEAGLNPSLYETEFCPEVCLLETGGMGRYMIGHGEQIRYSNPACGGMIFKPLRTMSSSEQPCGVRREILEMTCL